MPESSRVRLAPLDELDRAAWRRIREHFRDEEISRLNGTPPTRLPAWLLRVILRADARRPDRHTFGILDESGAFIGLTELYDIHQGTATLGIIIGERSHWNRGYGPEAISALLSIAFRDYDLKQVRLSTFEDNLRAQAAFRKVGFRELQRTTALGDKGRVSIWMGLPRERWLSRLQEAQRSTA